MEKRYTDWTRNLLEHLSIGGIWKIPRSGTIVERTGEKMVRITEGEGSEEELRHYIRAAGFGIEGEVSF